MTKSSYFLAVDVGTSRTACSVARPAADGTLVTAAFPLGRSSDTAPSTIFAADGELLFGEAAERRGLAQPERLVREFKRRVGDDVPISAGDQRFAADELYARMIAWVVDAVTEREGSRPAAISVAVPVTWGGHRSGLISAALAREVAGEIELISEPEAAARHYESTSPLETGRALAVYDLGGGTFDAVVLRKESDDTLRIVGQPLGISDFGGADFDDLVLQHVMAASGLSAAELATDSAARVALTTLRRECVEAKEALSFDSEAVVPVLAGQAHSTVRLTRSEFEEMIEDGVNRTVEVLSRALESAGVAPDDLDAILLTGGSSRIPRIAELLSEQFDRPIAVDADPKAVVALGAARALADGRAPASASLLLSPAAVTAAIGDETSTDLVPLDPASPAFDRGASSRTSKRRWFARLPAAAAMASGALVLTTGIVLASATGLGPSADSDTDPDADNSELSFADWLGVTLFDAPSAAADQAVAAPLPPSPPAAIQRADAPAPRATAKATNPRTRSMQKATQAAAAAPTSAAPSSGGTSPATGSTDTTAGTTDPGTDTTDPTTDPTTEPTTEPDPTTEPGPAPTQDPAPDPAPTQDPAPDPAPTQDPAPDPAPTQDPAPDPAPTQDPAPDPEPSPSPTNPV